MAIMKEKELFAIALKISSHWKIKEIKFDINDRRLDIYMDFPRGDLFTCPKCGNEKCKAYDTRDAVWRHLNFFQHKTYLHARRPRIDCKNCGIITAKMPWARMGSGFTYLFESFVMILSRKMPISAVAKLLGEHDTRIWRVVRYYVEDLSKLNKKTAHACQIKNFQEFWDQPIDKSVKRE